MQGNGEWVWASGTRTEAAARGWLRLAIARWGGNGTQDLRQCPPPNTEVAWIDPWRKPGPRYLRVLRGNFQVAGSVVKEVRLCMAQQPHEAPIVEYFGQQV